MKILVIGASGQVGAALMKVLKDRQHNAMGTYNTYPVMGLENFDLRHPAAGEVLVAKLHPDWIICPAAMANVDLCETQPELALKMNRDIVVSLAQAGKKQGAGFVYYSTDYVFDGTQGPYGEDDPTCPLNHYGRSKLEGEKALQQELDRVLILRTSVVFGPEHQKKNFVYRVVSALKKGQPLQVPQDQISNPTYNEDLALATVSLIEKGSSGVFNAAGPEVVNRYEFALQVCEEFKLDKNLIKPVATQDLNQTAKRPLNAGFRIKKLKALFPNAMRLPSQGLAAMYKVMPSN